MRWLFTETVSKTKHDEVVAERDELWVLYRKTIDEANESEAQIAVLQERCQNYERMRQVIASTVGTTGLIARDAAFKKLPKEHVA